MRIWEYNGVLLKSLMNGITLFVNMDGRMLSMELPCWVIPPNIMVEGELGIRVCKWDCLSFLSFFWIFHFVVMFYDMKSVFEYRFEQRSGLGYCCQIYHHGHIEMLSWIDY